MSRLAQIRLSSEKSDQIQVGEFGYLWNSYSSTKNCKALLESIEENADHYRNQLQSIISIVLGAAKKSIQSEYKSISIIPQLLWASGLVEQGTVKTDAWLNALRLIVFERELSSSRSSELTYRGSFSVLKQCLGDLSRKRGLNFKRQTTRVIDSSGLLRRAWKSFPLGLRAPIYLYRYLLRRWSLRKLSVPQWPTVENTLFIFSYFIHLDKKEAESGHFYSKQWEKLPQHLVASGFQLNWCHLFLTSSIVPNAQTAIKWLRRFHKDSEQQGTHALLDQYLDWKVVVRVLVCWICAVSFYLRHLRYKPHDLAQLDCSWLWPVFEKDWEDSWVGPVSIQNILWSHLFDKMLGSLPRQRLGLYLMENQGWERIFLHFWRKHGHGTIIGVPHSTIRYWDLRYFDTTTHKSLADLPQPDLVAVNGEHGWQMLQQSCYPMERCVSVEALRYQYLVKLKPVHLKKASKDINRLLVLGDIQPETTHQMLLELEKSYTLLERKVEIWIKPHPGNPVKLDRYPLLPANLKEQFLMELLPEVSVVLASVFTSASLDAFCAGLPVINYLDPNNFNFSPLRGHPKARFVSSAEEILQLLHDEQWLSTPSGANPSDFFWLDEELPRWTQLIQTTFAEHSKVNQQCSN